VLFSSALLFLIIDGVFINTVIQIKVSMQACGDSFPLPEGAKGINGYEISMMM
jgi:hypothetical protein